MHQPGPGVLRTDDLDWKDQSVCYFEVEKSGYANLNDLYSLLHQWFQKEEFENPQGDGNKIEDLYLHRIKGDGLQENLIWWRAVRPIGGGKNPGTLIWYFCKMDWQVFGSKPSEVMYKGKKIKTNKIGMVIRVWWWVQIDPYNKWEKSFLGKRFKWLPKWWYEYLLNTDMENHRDKCREIAKRQENEMKQFFEIQTDIPMPRSWFPEKGYKYTKVKPKAEDFEQQPRRGDYKLDE